MAAKGQEALAETVDTGAELYAARCQVCHGDREGRRTSQGAPPHNEAGHTWHHADAQLKDWIINGKLGFGPMPAFEGKLAESEVDAILAYIKTWWTPEQRETQADVSRRYQEALDRQQRGQ
jgi:S-disulfanyl-L-cysteine oxidoreductase SoxD